MLSGCLCVASSWLTDLCFIINFQINEAQSRAQAQGMHFFCFIPMRRLGHWTDYEYFLFFFVLIFRWRWLFGKVRIEALNMICIDVIRVRRYPDGNRCYYWLKISWTNPFLAKNSTHISVIPWHDIRVHGNNKSLSQSFCDLFHRELHPLISILHKWVR